MIRPLARRAALALALSLALCACAKLPPEMSAYAGDWRSAPGPGSDSTSLVIRPEGQLIYLRSEGSSRVKIEAPVHSYDGQSFKAGVLGFNAEFKINAPPRLVGGAWIMVIDGVELSRQD